jgi:hypothetical protein
MRTANKILVRTTFASLVGLAAAHPALAAPISGSDTVGGSVASSNETGSNLGTATTITLASPSETFSVFAPGVGSFGAIPIGTTVPLGSATFNLGNLASFGFASATVGTFIPTTLSAYNLSATSLNVFITGSFTPGTLFGAGATAPFGASENLGFTQTNGGVISFSGTFASPPQAAPTGVPEPLTITLFGAGLVGVGALCRRRKANRAS